MQGGEPGLERRLFPFQALTVPKGLFGPPGGSQVVLEGGLLPSAVLQLLPGLLQGEGQAVLPSLGGRSCHGGQGIQVGLELRRSLPELFQRLPALQHLAAQVLHLRRVLAFTEPVFRFFQLLQAALHRLRPLLPAVTAFRIGHSLCGIVRGQLRPQLPVRRAVLPAQGLQLSLSLSAAQQGKAQQDHPCPGQGQAGDGPPQRQGHNGPQHQGQKPQQEEDQGLLAYGVPVGSGIVLRLGLGLLGIQSGKGRQALRCRRLRLQVPLIPGRRLPGGTVIPQVIQALARLFLCGQIGTALFPIGFLPAGPFPVLPGLRHLPVFQGKQVVLQLPSANFRLLGLFFQPGTAVLQDRQPLQSILQLGQLGLGLGDQPLAAVFQVLQAVRQDLGIPGVVAGGHQIRQTGPQELTLEIRQIRLADKARPAEDLPLHPQDLLAAVLGRQLRNRQSGGRFIGPEFSQGNTASGAALYGDVPALPVQVDPTGHGLPGPGGVVVFGSQAVFCGFGPGIQAIEHGQQEGAPGALAPFVGCGKYVQPRLQPKGLPLQLAEGGGHGIDSHGSATSSPSRIFRDSSAARDTASRSSGVCSSLTFSRPK